MPKRKTKKAYKGGKMVAKGAYGCGYKPAIRCEGEDEREPGVFSKVMSSEEAEKEMKITELLQPIDPEQKYFLYPLKLCKLNKELLDPIENNLTKCNVIYDEDAVLLQFREGGLSLDNYNIRTKNAYAFFRDFRHFFEGLVILQEAGIAHLDIKFENLVFKHTEDGGFSFRFIDFGLTSEITEYNPILHAYYDYRPWPYEIKFAWKTFNHNKIKLEKFIEANSHVVSFIKGYDLEKLNSLYENMDKMKREEKWPLAKSKVDVYSLGVVLAIFFQELIPFFESGVVFNKKMGTFTILEKERNNPFINGVVNELLYPMYNFLQKILDLDYRSRLDAKQALEEYSALLPAIKKYLGPKNSSTGGGRRRRRSTKKRRLS